MTVLLLVVGACDHNLLAPRESVPCQSDVVCDDGNPCTEGRCDPNRGCIYSWRSDDSPCGPTRCENTSWLEPRCRAGVCTDTLLEQCDDSNLCTDDSCDPIAGCAYAAAPATPCGLGACNGLLYQQPLCVDGGCVPQVLDDCDDQNPCTEDACDDVLGCQNTPSALGKPCGSPGCAGSCRDGFCVAAPSGTCNDGTGCTFDGCLPDDACYNGDVPLGMNVLRNPGFEVGTTAWQWCTKSGCAGTSTLEVTLVPGLQGSAVRLRVLTSDPIMQLYQAWVPLEPDSDYRIEVTGRSETSSTILAEVIEHAPDHSLYGPDYPDSEVQLTPTWQTHTVTFRTLDNFPCEPNARLRIRVLGSKNALYEIDHVTLIREGP